MKTFSYKKYKIEVFTNIEECNNEFIHNIPNNLIVNNSYYFVITDKQTSEYVLSAVFTIDSDYKEIAHVYAHSNIHHVVQLKSIIKKITSYMYNHTDALYFKIDSSNIHNSILLAAISAGYRRDKNDSAVYILNENFRVGIAAVIALL